MSWITMFRRFRKDRRGVSNIIVVALSLVIILAIVTDIVLWNYEMNQVDYEKMKENIILSNVEQISHSSWFSVQNEYSINFGSRIDGDFLDTKYIDSSYESFTENASGSNNITLISSESFENIWPPTNWESSGNWAKESNYAYDQTYSADFDGSTGGASGYLIFPTMDCSDADTIFVDFWWQDRALSNDDLEIEYYNGSSWNNYQDLNQLDSENGWHHYIDVISDIQYFVSNFQIRLWAKTIYSGRTACVDFVTIKKSVSETNSFDMVGSFKIDLSKYKPEYVKTVEILLHYKSEDSSENWYLEAYDWVSSTFSNIGFNSTEGHTPTMVWDYYSITLTDTWQNYVNSNGTINVKLLDEGPDTQQTSISIDFFGIRVKIDATQFTFKNNGSFTVHLVSLWIIDATEHQHYDITVFVNSAEAQTYLRNDILLPAGIYSVKVVTERGNIAVYSRT
ncbi:MAG: hypothetical protein P8Y18_11295 [Candidatus Bathyarchaeota archaeon]